MPTPLCMSPNTLLCVCVNLTWVCNSIAATWLALCGAILIIICCSCCLSKHGWNKFVDVVSRMSCISLEEKLYITIIIFIVFYCPALTPEPNKLKANPKHCTGPKNLWPVSVSTINTTCSRAIRPSPKTPDMQCVPSSKQRQQPSCTVESVLLWTHGTVKGVVPWCLAPTWYQGIISIAQSRHYVSNDNDTSLIQAIMFVASFHLSL